MTLRRVYINDAVREWLTDKPSFFWTPRGILSAAALIQDEDNKMRKIASDIIKDRYGEIRPEVIPEPGVE